MGVVDKTGCVLVSGAIRVLVLWEGEYLLEHVQGLGSVGFVSKLGWEVVAPGFDFSREHLCF